MANSFDRIYAVAVSYTHLDVYKRQNYLCAVLWGAERISIETTLSIEGDVPVSYTHLDVYKRQA